MVIHKYIKNRSTALKGITKNEERSKIDVKNNNNNISYKIIFHHSRTDFINFFKNYNLFKRRRMLHLKIILQSL